MSVTPGELAARLPDVPRLVETRAMLLSGACEVLGDGSGGNYVVRSLDTALAAVVGRPSEGSIREAASRHMALEILCAEDVIEHTVAALPGWSAGAAAVHVLAQRCAPPPPDGPLDVRLVNEEQHVPLTHVPPDLRRELEAARRRSPFSIAFVEGRAVSFAYIPWQTEGLYDLSIDTLEAYQQQGLGAATVWLLIEHLRVGGKQPVWGTMEDNVPSLRLAARLGFMPVDRLFVLSRRTPAEETLMRNARAGAVLAVTVAALGCAKTGKPAAAAATPTPSPNAQATTSAKATPTPEPPGSAGTVSASREAEEACVDRWLAARGLDPYGNPAGTVYAGGTPLFDERIGERVDRLAYVYKRQPLAREACRPTAIN